LDAKNGPAMKTTTTKEELLDYFKEMTLMRRVEMAADVAYKNRLIRGFLHLYDGQVCRVMALRLGSITCSFL
jgi:pyruvate dehydrogenase E1 component alpha subunit